jgi:protein-tyrosine phosphatase
MAYRLLFVCLGNICRSPSAENIMNHLIQERGLSAQIECDSAGTSGYHVGASPDRRMSAAAERKLGFKLKGSSRQFESYDFDEFDLILAMDKDNYEQMSYVDRTSKNHHKLKLMCDFCTKHDLKEVPDPYYGGEAGFNFVIDLLIDACNGLLDRLLADGAIND